MLSFGFTIQIEDNISLKKKRDTTEEKKTNRKL